MNIESGPVRHPFYALCFPADGGWRQQLGLRIADGSVMPSITSGNTNSPILMIAERAALWVNEAAIGSA